MELERFPLIVVDPPIQDAMRACLEAERALERRACAQRELMSSCLAYVAGTALWFSSIWVLAFVTDANMIPFVLGSLVMLVGFAVAIAGILFPSLFVPDRTRTREVRTKLQGRGFPVFPLAAGIILARKCALARTDPLVPTDMGRTATRATDLLADFRHDPLAELAEAIEAWNNLARVSTMDDSVRSDDILLDRNTLVLSLAVAQDLMRQGPIGTCQNSRNMNDAAAVFQSAHDVHERIAHICP